MALFKSGADAVGCLPDSLQYLRDILSRTPNLPDYLSGQYASAGYSMTGPAITYGEWLRDVVKGASDGASNHMLVIASAPSTSHLALSDYNTTFHSVAMSDYIRTEVEPLHKAARMFKSEDEHLFTEKSARLVGDAVSVFVINEPVGRVLRSASQADLEATKTKGNDGSSLAWLSTFLHR
jgi:hypothetical protein